MASNVNSSSTNNNNQVHYFNPNTSFEDFQKIIQSTDSSEELIKLTAYAALAKYKVEELTAGLDPTLVSKIKKIEVARNKEIRDFVNRLNNFGKSKSDFHDDNDGYRNYKEVLKEIKKFSYLINNPSVRQEILEIGSEAEKQVSKIENNTQYVCCVHDPFRGFFNYFSNLSHALETIKHISDGRSEEECIANQTLIETKGHAQNAKTSIKEIIVNCLIDGESYESIKQYVIDHNQEYPTYACDLEIFEELFKFAEKEYPEIKAQRDAASKKRFEDNKSNLLQLCKIVQLNYDQFKDEPSYQQFSIDKQDLINKLKEVATFCLSTELLNHKQLTPESKERFERLIKKL